MKVTEQIDPLEAVAVDSFKFLVVTRVVACMLAMPILTSVMNFTGSLCLPGCRVRSNLLDCTFSENMA